MPIQLVGLYKNNIHQARFTCKKPIDL